MRTYAHYCHFVQIIWVELEWSRQRNNVNFVKLSFVVDHNNRISSFPIILLSLKISSISKYDDALPEV